MRKVIIERAPDCSTRSTSPVMQRGHRLSMRRLSSALDGLPGPRRPERYVPILGGCPVDAVLVIWAHRRSAVLLPWVRQLVCYSGARAAVRTLWMAPANPGAWVPDGLGMADAEVSRGENLSHCGVALWLFRLAVASAGIVTVVAVVYSGLTTMTFWGDPAGPRLEAISSKALWVSAWGVGSAAGVVVVRRKPRAWLAVVVTWVALLAMAQPWWWPLPPEASSDARHVPIWLEWRYLLWAHAAFVVMFAVVSQWRSGTAWRVVVAGCAIALAAALMWSNQHLHARDRSEDPVPTAHGQRTLAEAEVDEIWTALPSDQSVQREGVAGARTAWGAEQPATVKWDRLVTDETRRMVFEEAVAAAESAGWKLAFPYCGEETLRASYAKELPSGPAQLRISVSSFLSHMTVSLTMAPVTVSIDEAPCW